MQTTVRSTTPHEHGHKKRRELVHVPTKLIFGVAATLVASVVLVTAVVAAAPVFAVVVVVLPETTTGSVEGIGLPSLVCNFTT